MLSTARKSGSPTADFFTVAVRPSTLAHTYTDRRWKKARAQEEHGMKHSLEAMEKTEFNAFSKRPKVRECRLESAVI
jgi:hypothetical protein